MKIILENTSKIIKIDGVHARVWEGKSESGTKVIAMITRIAVSEEEPSEVQDRFRTELQEVKAPSPNVEAWPLSLIL